MSPDEWKKHVQQWQQRGGVESSKPPDPNAPPTQDSGGDGGWLGSAGAFAKGAGRELATQGGFAKDFAQGSDPAHPTAEWLGREAVDFAPGAALDVVSPELGLINPAIRGAKYVRPLVDSAIKGYIGGASANPDDRQAGGKSGAEIGAGSAALGQVMSSRPVHRMLLPAAIMAEVAQHAGVIPHGALGGLYPWAMAHGLSALGGLARAAGFAAPATTGAVGSQIQRSLSDGDQAQ